MKQIKFIAMAVAALAMFSCAKEKNFVNDEAQGEPVYAQFDIKLPSQVSRATGDGNGTDAEEAVKDVSVYIITNGKVEAVATTGKAGEKTAKVQITTGKKQILAVVNGKDCGLTAFTVGATLGDIDLAVIESAANAVKKNGTTGTTESVLFTSKMLPVTIKAPNSTDGIETKPWPVPVNVEHAMAKVVVRNNIVARINGVTATIGNTENADPTKDTRPKFALNGMVSNAALYQHLDPNGLVVNSTNTTKAIAWDWRLTPATTGGSPAAKLSFMPMAGSTTDTPAIGTITGEGKNGGIYTLEGVVASGSANNKSTQIYAKVDILPDASFTTATNTVGAKIADDDNYFVVKHATLNNYRFFKTEADFTTWKTTHGTGYEPSGVLYTKGENYYLVKIVHDAAVATHKFSVLRNNIYEVTLKNVNAFGSNESGTIVTPTDPIETNVWIEATITLAPWTVKSQTSDLE